MSALPRLSAPLCRAGLCQNCRCGYGAHWRLTASSTGKDNPAP
ncbi:MAG: hypothetical protein OXU61_04145 [Gammaproteobacteria bacterium]|nr:hypothetical protein [Gammaproteobacteria bacterium]